MGKRDLPDDSGQKIYNEQIMLQAAVEQSGDVIFMTDPEGNITYVNPRFEDVYGYTPNEAIGQTPRILKSGAMSQENYEDFWRTILSGEVAKGEYPNKRKDGSLVVIEGSANPVTDEAGIIVGFFAIQRDITERKRREEELKHMSLHDQLTGFYNRHYFDDRMVTLKKSREQDPISIITIDINDLKLVNDQTGHEKGDELLINTADLLRTVFRPEDCIARMGGDEFTILLPKVDGKEAQIIIVRINEAINTYNLEHIDFPISLAIGVATAANPTNLDEALTQADNNMYKNKKAQKLSNV